MVKIKSSSNKKKVGKKGSLKNKVRAAKKSQKNTKLKCPPNMRKLKTDGELLCVGVCPHSGGPIYYNPKLKRLVCKWHGSQFDSKTGAVLTPPAKTKLPIKRL